jgi:hypothetical protein
MAALATPAQLASRLKQDVDTSTAQLALDGASGFVRAICRQQFDFVSQETVIVKGGERVLRVPQRPLIVDSGPNLLTVVEVGEFGGIDVTMVEDRDYSRVGNELTRGYPWWWNNTQRLMGYPRTRPLGVWAPRVRLTYSHGYVTMPDDVVAVVLDAAAVLYDNPTALRQVTIDDYTETRAAEMLGTAMVESIRDKLGITGRRPRAFSIRTA